MAAKKSVWKWLVGAVCVIWLSQLDSSETQTSSQLPMGNGAIKVELTLPKPKPVLQPDGSRNNFERRFDPNATQVKLSPSPSEPTAKIVVGQTMYVDASRLNVRNGPNKSDKVIWTLKRDQAVQVTDVRGNWSFITGAKYQGWVFSTFLTRNKAPKQQASLPSTSLPTVHRQPGLSKAAITKLLIDRSLAYYSGNCPCPYNRDRAGRRCGRRSAYTRPGGESPLCYSADITAAMISDYRSRQ